MQKTNKSNNNISKKRNQMFNYDIETQEEQSKVRKKMTKKLKQTEKRIDDEFIIGENASKKNKKKIKEIKKRKQKENKNRRKEIIKSQREDEKKQKVKLKKKLNNKQIQKRKRTRIIIRNAFILILCITAVILFLLSPIFYVKNIEIKENERISKEEIVSLLNVESNTNIFKETKKGIIKKVKENPYIDEVDVKKVLPSTIEITIKERNVDYLLEVGSSYAYINNQGYILEISPNKIERKIKVIGYVTSVESIIPGERLCDEDLEKLNVVNQISYVANNTNIDELITKINIENSDNYVIYFESEGKTAYLGDNNNLKTKMLFIKKIIETEKGKEGEIFVNRDVNNKKSFFAEKV